MATLSVGGCVQVITCGLKFLVITEAGVHGKVVEVPSIAKEEDNKEDSNGLTPGPRVISSAVSQSGSHLALCDDFKQVTVWLLLPEPRMISHHILPRKGSRIIFSPDSKHILVADKNGDVHLLDLEKPDQSPLLLLGHLSMLLDVRMSLDCRFVLTADRDEKIRVSRFPNSYNIHNYCLGHRDFVTSLSVLSDNLLVSGSGDGSVRVWKFLEGRTVASREVLNDINIEKEKGTNNIENDTEKCILNDKNETEQCAKDIDVKEKVVTNTPRVEPSLQPVVTNVLALKSNLFLVQVDSFKGLLVYGINFGILNDSSVISLKDSLSLDGFLLDLDFDVSSETLYLLLQDGCTFRMETFKVEFSKLVKQSSCDLSDRKEFFSPAENSTNVAVSFHKRWFDNVKDYLEKKESRMEQMKRKDPPVKKQKLNVC